MKPVLTGILLCILAVALQSASNVFAQGAMQHLAFLSAALLWFAAAVCWFSIAAVFRRRNPFPWLRKHWRIGLIIGGMNFLSTITWFYAINAIGPSTTGFLQRFQTLVMLFLGIALLHESLSRWEIVAMALAFSGAALITFSLEHALWFGMLMAFLCAIAGGVHDFFAKRYLKGINPFTLSTVRVWYTLFFLIPFALPQFSIPTIAALRWVFVGPMLSAFFGYWMFFVALKRIPLSGAAIIANAQPFFVMAYAFLLFGTTPTSTALIGGCLIVLGVLIPLLRKAF